MNSATGPVPARNRRRPFYVCQAAAGVKARDVHGWLYRAEDAELIAGGIAQIDRVEALLRFRWPGIPAGLPRTQFSDRRPARLSPRQMIWPYSDHDALPARYPCRCMVGRPRYGNPQALAGTDGAIAAAPLSNFRSLPGRQTLHRRTLPTSRRRRADGDISIELIPNYLRCCGVRMINATAVRSCAIRRRGRPSQCRGARRGSAEKAAETRREMA